MVLIELESGKMKITPYKIRQFLGVVSQMRDLLERLNHPEAQEEMTKIEGRVQAMLDLITGKDTSGADMRKSRFSHTFIADATGS